MIAYYDANAKAYHQETVNLDLFHLYDEFLQYLPKGASILDVGCGAGRDFMAFSARGYRVIGVDASVAMCQLARTNSKASADQIINMPFEKVHWPERFDGIWANASLVHLTEKQIAEVICSLMNSLRPKGVFYLSLKEKWDEEKGKDRLFLSYNQEKLIHILSSIPKIIFIKTWNSADLRAERKNSLWINTIFQKASETGYE
ncbi:MAG: hypothetical protein A2504_09805 [Bdellovibrionales bacterium RIFOXYD12_FULL_39_22]|nr:MAG: hypothetical protein A2385_13295 [Bdellovibrionales bacterium RIFOXYB1_FULL_39_21]OFZ41024.1 MAG: hypothetical protein A2485_16805 [Bdellovibrionales bacterium RIFOXYC12_FULL_39_17]OFZ44852.1 MAG: hypothetical protein A2404_10095 [Bdellovibrionales bacterium RIFOXYC1_FULL_39_130]OFZ68016.1 MAG: hypothetical protein A2451_14150 [Bdellovibrionales bacterium RIFOXYC2_FULL_39_8]OFZ74317.1 MAG: hypothetical protein A2560_17060 [Bdellovibrionales bacterium RIFOXYD1_FULL_39_84]OFZ92181.1 MAG: